MHCLLLMPRMPIASRPRRFYVMALGNEVDLHTPNMESASIDWLQRNQNAVMLLPGDMETSDVQLTAEGRWVFQCRVADHISAGALVYGDDFITGYLPYGRP